VRDLLLLAFLLPILLGSMMAHEVSHGYVAYRLGDPTAKMHGRLTANPLRHLDPLGTIMFVVTYLIGPFVFGWAKPVPINPYHFRNHQRGMMIVGLAGPAANFAVAVVLAIFLNLLEPSLNRGGMLFEVLFLAFQVNVVLGIFNLVPIPPLDGSRVMGGFLPPNLYRQWADLDRYGMLFIFVIIFLLNDPFFSLLSEGFRAVSRVLLPAYF
jgi:Zn-dependent protease